MCPAAQGGGIGQAERVLAVRRRLLHGSARGDVRAGLLAATQGERRRRREPVGQDREGRPAGMTDSAAHPNGFVAVIVGRAEPPSMTDDRLLLTDWTLPREEIQRDHPGTVLSFVSGSVIKRITAGVKARRDRSLRSFDLPAGPSPSGKVSFERKQEYSFLLWDASPHPEHWPV